jgi:uncharacterized protein (DUF983 family)
MEQLAERPVASLAAGAVTVLIARSSRTAVVTGAVLLLMFIPQHINLWDKFPIWYHLTFLTSLVPLAAVGARMWGPNLESTDSSRSGTPRRQS